MCPSPVRSPRQAPVLLQTVQLWSVLTRLATTETTEQRDGERLPEIPYLEP